MLRIILLFFAVLSCRAWAVPEHFYVAAKDGIYYSSIDSETGLLDGCFQVQELADPLFLAQSPTHPVLYACAGTGVVAYKELSDGSLQLLGKLDIQGKNICHLTCDDGGKFLLAADYDNHSVSVVSLGDKGEPRKLVDVKTFVGSGPNKERQEASHPHSVYLDPENRHAYVCDLGADKIWIFDFDDASGDLAPADPPSISVKPGTGPRHLAFAPYGGNVYVNGELGANLIRLRHEHGTGGLRVRDEISTLTPDRPTTDGGTGEIVRHPNGRWLYVSNRLGNTIAVFSIAPDGKATLVEDAPSVADFVRSFWIDPSGRWIVAAGQKDNCLAALKIDQKTGRLSQAGQRIPVPGKEPLCVLFVPPVK